MLTANDATPVEVLAMSIPSLSNIFHLAIVRMLLKATTASTSFSVSRLRSTLDPRVTKLPFYFSVLLKVLGVPAESPNRKSRNRHFVTAKERGS